MTETITIIQIVSALLFWGGGIYTAAAALRSKQKGLALYKFIIIRVTVILVLLFLTESAVSYISLTPDLERDFPQNDNTGVETILFLSVFPVVGLLGIFAVLATAVMYGAVIAALWIIYAVCSRKKKKQQDQQDNILQQGDNNDEHDT